jgi:hypothetical protein
MLSLHPRSASLPVMMTWDNSVHVEHAFRSPLSDMAFVFVSVAFNCIRFKPDIDVHVGQHLSRGAKTPFLTNASAFRAWHSTSLACGPDLRVHVELGIQRSSLTRKCSANMSSVHRLRTHVIHASCPAWHPALSSQTQHSCLCELGLNLAAGFRHFESNDGLVLFCLLKG